MVELNGNGYTITKVSDDTFTIGVDTSGYTTYTSGGKVYLNTNTSAFTTYSSGGKARKAVASLSNIDHLEAESVDMLGNGNVYSAATVSSGAISSISPEVSIAHVGLGSVADVLTLRPEAGADDGTAQGKTKRVVKVTARFRDTLGAKVGPDASNLDEINFRGGSDPMDSSPPLFTGDKEITFRGGWDKKGQILIRQDQPLPMHLLAIMQQIVTNDG
jgi:hypothetical protein